MDLSAKNISGEFIMNKYTDFPAHNWFFEIRVEIQFAISLGIKYLLIFKLYARIYFLGNIS